MFFQEKPFSATTATPSREHSTIMGKFVISSLLWNLFCSLYHTCVDNVNMIYDRNVKGRVPCLRLTLDNFVDVKVELPAIQLNVNNTFY